MSSTTTHDRLDKRRRLQAILGRDGPQCFWCAVPFDDGSRVATTEHLVPRLKGGPSWIENEVAACKPCNQRRGHTALGAWVVQCQQQGYPSRPAEVLSRLAALSAAIERRGGQRRARRYIASQNRRLRKMKP